MTTTAPTKLTFWDRLGFSVSLICVLHCLLTPLLLVSLPMVGHCVSGEWVHVLMALIIFPVAVWALWRGYNLHRHKIVLQLGIIGLSLIAVGLFANGLNYEYMFTAIGGVFLATAHLKNLRYCKKCAL